MAKSRGPMSKAFGSMVDGKDDELGEPPDNEGAEGEQMDGISGMHIDKGANGFSVHVHREPKKGEELQSPSRDLPHFFSASHPIARHIHAILKHTKKK